MRWLLFFSRFTMLLLLICAACNINVPNATPTPPPRTPRVTLSPRPTITESLPTVIIPSATIGPSPVPLTSPTPSATTLAFILRQTPIAPDQPSPTPRSLPTRNPFQILTITPRIPLPTFAPTILVPNATALTNLRATPFPTIPPTVALRVTLAPQLPRNWQLTPIANQLNDLSRRSYSIDGSGNLTGGIPSDLPGTPTFVRENPNPAHPIQFAARNSLGSLYFIHRDGITERLTVSPASIFEASDATSNRAFIADLSWTADGVRLSLLIHSDYSEEDGVWWMQPGVSNPERLLVDCPRPQHPGCQIVDRRLGPFSWRTRTVQWSPDNASLLAQIEIYDPNLRPALALLQPGRDYNQIPPILYYDYGSWLSDGDLMVSGNGPDGRNVVAILSPNGVWKRNLYFNESLPMHYAHEASDGQIYALGNQEGQLALYRLVNGRANIIGSSHALPWPEFAHWDPAREALDLTIAGRVTSLYITPSAAPPSPHQSGFPTGVEIGAQFSPGEQLRVISLSLNLRVEPSLNGEIITTLNQGDFVRVLAGPYFSGAETWWQVQDALGRIGWLASESDGIPLLDQDAAG